MVWLRQLENWPPRLPKSCERLQKGKRFDIAEFCGGLGMREQIQQLKKITKPTIAVGTPGRVIDHLSKKRMRVDTLRWFIIDEVDEMLNFGFKEDMDQIVSFLPKDRRTIILSATLPKFVG